MDSNFQPQQNPGSFMSSDTGQQPGQGSALMRLMQLRQLGATPQAGNNTPLPAAPVSSGQAIDPSHLQQAPQAQPAPQPTPQPPGSQTFQAGDPNLQIALSALSNYIGSHGKALEANHEVPRKTAEAKVLASQAQPPASPVS